MAFTLQVIFTGLCAFIENEDPHDPTRMCVVLVNGTRPERERDVRAIDGTPLRYHRPFVTFPIRDIQPPISDVNGLPMAHGIWYLNRERLLFDITEETGAMNDFNVRRPNLGDPHPEVPEPRNPDHLASFTWVPDLTQVAPRHKTIDEDVVASSNVSQNVIAQVLIRRGSLRPFSFTRAIWEFDRHLSEGRAHRRNFAHEASLTLTRLTSANLISRPLDQGGVERKLPLTPASDGGIVTIKISNLCEVNPLQWFTTREPAPDHDIKWFYEILSPGTKERLRADLDGRTLPIPRPVQFLIGFGGPGSGNCIPIQTANAFFSFP